MQLSRLLALVKGLRVEEYTDLMAFLAYRHQATRLPGRLTSHLRQAEGTVSKAQVCKALNITDGSFRVGKTELAHLIIEWQMLNSSSWNMPEIRGLMAAQTLMGWGEHERAYRQATETQQKALDGGYYLVARLGLQLRSASVQRMGAIDIETQMTGLEQEMNGLKNEAERFSAIAGLHARAASLVEKGRLLRTDGQMAPFLKMEMELQQLTDNAPEMTFYQEVFHVQTRALLDRTRGDILSAYDHLLQIWFRLKVLPRTTLIGDQRLLRFFVHFVELGIRCGETDSVKTANTVFRASILRHCGNDQRLLALHQVFSDLILLQRTTNTLKAHNHLRQTIGLIHASASAVEGDFNISEWEPCMCASTLPLLIQTCFNQRLFKECRQLLGLVKQMDGRATGATIELQTITPLICLAIRYEELIGTRSDRTSDPYFEADTNYCYHHFRKHQHSHPIEWTMARLFYGLCSGKKSTNALFSEADTAMTRHRSETHYFNPMMLLFEFDSWISSHAKATVLYSVENPT